MTHVPFGYKIENGSAAIDDQAAEALRTLYEEFIECKSMRAAAKIAGINKTHSVVGRLLKNTIYLGTDFYPQIIDDEIFGKAQEVRNSNARSQNRIRDPKPQVKFPEKFFFEIGDVEIKYKDPYEQAEFAYSQVEEILQ